MVCSNDIKQPSASFSKLLYTLLTLLVIIIPPFSAANGSSPNETSENEAIANNTNEASTATSQIPPLPISAYGNLPAINQVKLSPSGNRIAMVKNVRGTLVLSTYDFITKEKKFILQADNVEVLLNWYVWGNDDILLISAAYPTRQGMTKYTSTRLYKYDLTKGDEFKLLIKPKSAKKEIAGQFQDNVISFMPEQEDIILMAIDFDITNKPSVYEVNIRTKKIAY